MRHRKKEMTELLDTATRCAKAAIRSHYRQGEGRL